MKSITLFLQFISDNYMSFIVIFLLLVGIYLRIVKFFKQPIEDQREQIAEEADRLKDYIGECLFDLIRDAEQKYGSGTGVLKKSEVYKQIVKLFPSMEDYITNGYITTDEIGELIDEAVVFINDKAKSNQKLSKIYSKD